MENETMNDMTAENLDVVENVEVEAETEKKQDIKIVKTDEGAINGQDKCPKCGSTDVAFNPETGKLVCSFCRHTFDEIKISGLVEDLTTLEGVVVGSGASNIVTDTDDMMTFKCSSCGAEVVIDTKEALQARCHWCRNTLSINQQIPNGAIPDVVLPFKLKKEEAQELISNFVNKRKFFANTQFKEEFNIDNIMGVYSPYMCVDINAHANYAGLGEHQTRRYTVGNDKNRRTYYDADVYRIEREFGIVIDGLTVESKADKREKNSNRTNNIINSIMPYDIENAVKWNANYLKGFTSEKRDTDVENLQGIVEIQSNDVARFAANDSLEFYDRGVAWETQDLEIIGQQWKAAYLPMWLYSYQEGEGEKSKLHYVAVNARTKETMGSIPVHVPKLLLCSVIFQLLIIVAMFFMKLDGNTVTAILSCVPGIAFYILNAARYRNTSARHFHELESKCSLRDERLVDEFSHKNNRQSNSSMYGANNKKVNGK